VAETEVVTNTFAETATATMTDTMTETITPAVEVTTIDTSEGSISADPTLLAAGLAAYRAQYCGVCHTLNAAETRGTFGPEHNGMEQTAATRLADPNYSGTATSPAEYVHESIVDPQAYIVPGYATTSHRMPSYAHLDTATLDALVAFLLAQ
jgi:nitric oxide reductase subunit C